jgi:RNA polymerase sigma-70 factor (ECF subfamily)
MNLKIVDGLTLIREIKAGNELAFNELFSRYEKYLKALAYYKLRDIELAKEVVIDVIFSIWQRRHHINVKKTIEGYLYSAVKKRCMNKLRNILKYKRTILYIEAPVENYGYEPACVLGRKEIGQAILQAIANIPSAVNRAAFEMYYLGDLPQREIAKKLNTTESAIKMRIYRAVKEVRPFLWDIYKSTCIS